MIQVKAIGKVILIIANTVGLSETTVVVLNLRFSINKKCSCLNTNSLVPRPLLVMATHSFTYYVRQTSIRVSGVVS